MGTRGPVPKRSDQRRRRNRPDDGGAEVIHLRAAEKVTWPRTPGHWHPVAKRLFKSLKESGQAALYEPSDVAVAHLLCEAISRELKPQPIVVGQGETAKVRMLTVPLKGSSLAAYLKGLNALMATEGDRRRLRIELERPKPGAPPQEADVLGLHDLDGRVPPAPS